MCPLIRQQVPAFRCSQGGATPFRGVSGQEDYANARMLRRLANPDTTSPVSCSALGGPAQWKRDSALRRSREEHHVGLVEYFANSIISTPYGMSPSAVVQDLAGSPVRLEGHLKGGEA